MVIISFSSILKKYLSFSEPEDKSQFVLNEDSQDSYNKDTSNIKNDGIIPCMSAKLEDNLSYMKTRYTIPLNSDVIIREFEVTASNQRIRAFALYYDGMVDRKIVNDDILYPLMIFSNIERKNEDSNILMEIKGRMLPSNQMKESTDYDEVVKWVNAGGCGIFIDGIDHSIIVDAKGYEHRGIEKPSNEQSVRGPQEAFNEVMRTNTAQVRKRLNDEDLIVESFELGRRSKTQCALLYIKDIANDKLINEVRRRLNGIDADYLTDSGQLEQLIEDSAYVPIPQMLATERPDKIAYYLSQGRVSIIINGTPNALVLPITAIDALHTSEDNYTRYPYSNLLRIIRIIGAIFGLLLPSVYIALTNYHQEMIPTSLLLAIQATREKVPFPSVVEIFIMEISFELIREAGIRIPGMIGPTLGIIGALILGQAAVSANIVSPILIVIVSITGLGSFTIPEYSFGYSIRIIRFIFILLSFIAGFLGLTTGVMVYLMILCSAKSFGVAIMAPYGPRVNTKRANYLFKNPAWAEEERPDYLNPKDVTREPSTSKKWDIPKGSEDDSNE